MTFHPTAWLVWLGSAVVVILGVDQPLATALTVATLALVAVCCAPAEPSAGSYAVMLKLGMVFIAARVVLFGLTGHTGPTTLVVLPSVTAPTWLGGFAIGGRITAEVVTLAIAEGLKVAAVLAAFGVFLSVVPIAKVVRAVPSFLHEAGLVVGIALTFVPLMLRTASDIRDAQRMRGHRFRGLRSLRALVIPVLAGAMERSYTLAASMDARGYGRRGPRTRYRQTKLDIWDVGVMVSAIAAGAVALVARLSGHGWWYAYPVAQMPEVHPLTIAPALTLLGPVVLGATRGWMLARAQRPIPIEALEATR